MVCKVVTALLKNAINISFLPRLRLSGKRTKGGQRMVAAAQKNRPLVKAAVPALRKFCGAAVFSCKGCGSCRCVLRRKVGARIM